MSDANMLRGYSLKKSPLNIQNAKDYKGAERVLVDDEGNQENWWDQYQNPIRNDLSTVSGQAADWVPNKLQRSLKKDANEPGWASGVDDLARILLDNKSDIKFNKRLMTRDGAVYWVNARNARFPDAKPWKVKVTDVNKDGDTEVLILDGEGNVRYVNGWHLGKSKYKLQKAHQEWIESEYGNPSRVAELKREGYIAPGQLSFQKFMYDMQEVNPDNPDGPLKVNEYLAKTGYKSRPLNPCNLFLKYVVKPHYDQALDYLAQQGSLSKERVKKVRAVASIIQLNATLYKYYVSSPAIGELRERGESDSSMQKKKKGMAVSLLSETCARKVQEIAQANEQDQRKKGIHESIERALVAAVEATQNYSTLEKQLPINPRKGGNSALNVDQWLQGFE
ncbi:hypothetical protein [Methanobrevibacter smithii]|uniref:hypothetical protein n=1 Tax=Methanobrevibacter smithii TaxID=2173 RepID=UPI0037DDD14A